MIDKALGNIKSSQKSMDFIGLLENKNNQISLVHYLYSPEGGASSS